MTDDPNGKFYDIKLIKLLVYYVLHTCSNIPFIRVLCVLGNLFTPIKYIYLLSPPKKTHQTAFICHNVIIS